MDGLRIEPVRVRTALPLLLPPFLWALLWLPFLALATLLHVLPTVADVLQVLARVLPRLP